MNLTEFLTDNKFGLLIDLRSMADTTMHGSGTRLVNTDVKTAYTLRLKGLPRTLAQ